MFGWIASTILGISLIDIYSLEVISWIKDTSIYKWYSELFYPKEVISQVKENKSSEFQFPKRITEKTSENETGHSRISEWINRNNQKEIEETKEFSIIDIIQNNSKAIFIVTGVIIIKNLFVKFIEDRASPLWRIKKCSKLFNRRLLFVKTLNSKQLLQSII